MRPGTVGMTLVLVMICGEAVAVETRIIVRALAKDAKFIGTSVEGAEVIIRDAATAEVMKCFVSFCHMGMRQRRHYATHHRHYFQS